MINIVIPMAGSGSRFQEAGYRVPKPFIDLHGKPMIQRVFENLLIENAHYYFLVKKEHMLSHGSILKEFTSSAQVTILPLEKPTPGTAYTILHAAPYINSNSPLLIANCDQIVDIKIENFIHDAQLRHLDGSILTFFSSDSKWSYVKLADSSPYVAEVREKVVISNLATVGIYYFSHGHDFISAAIEMILNNDRVNGEFYTCPSYNYAIKRKKKIGVYHIDQHLIHGLGTPHDVDIYLNK